MLLAWVEGNQPPQHQYRRLFFVPGGTTQTDVRNENTDVREVGFHPPFWPYSQTLEHAGKTCQRQTL